MKPVPTLRALATASILGLTAVTTAQTEASAPRIQPYPIDLPTGYQKAIENGTRTLTGKPGANYWTNYAHYDIAMELDVEAKIVTATAKMTYHNRSPHALRRLVVHLRQNMMKPGMQRTRTIQTTSGIELGSVVLDGDELGRAARARGTLLYITLPQSLQPDEKTTLTIDYSYEVPKAGTAPRNGWEGEDVFYLAYWYPQFAVYDDVAGWVADPYKGNGEFYMGYADYDLAITAPKGYLVRATGELQNAKEVLTKKAIKQLEKAKTSRDIVPIISADDLEAGLVTKKGKRKLTWKFRAENVRDTAVSIARTYVWDACHAVVKDKHGEGKDGTCMIHSVYETNAGDWVRGAEYARHTIEYMSENVHPYPWPQMTACEGIIGGGMEFPMMTIIGGRRPAGTIAHELIHMWFPMLVGSNEKRYAWQDEGFTSFWTTLCRDDFTGRSVGPQRAVMGYGNVVRRGGDIVCMRHGDTYGTESFGFASYSKPAAILHQLRGLLGDDVFFNGFKRYAADWAFKHPMPYDFFHTFSDHAGVDLEPYFRTWFFEKWALDHAIAEVQASGNKTIVTVEDRGRALMPTIVEATFTDGTSARQRIDPAHWQKSRTAVLEFNGKAAAVVIDPDIQALDADRGNNAWEADKK